MSLHLSRAGVGQGTEGIAGCRLLRSVRPVREQDRRRLFLKEGELEFLEADGVACLLQPLRHILRGTIVADRACRTVAAARGGDVLQCLQVPECALTNGEIAAGRRATNNVISPGDEVCRNQDERSSQTDTPASPTKVQYCHRDPLVSC